MALDLGTLVGHVKLDDAQFQTSIKGAKDKVAGLKRDLASLGTTKARIDADSAGADARIKALKAELAGLDKEVKLGVVTEATDARIKQVKAELASVSDTKAKIDVNSAEASARIREVKAQLAELSANDHTARVKVDVDRSSVQGISTLTAALLTLGPALAPLAVVSVGGIAAMGPALLAGGAAAGVAALAFHGVGEALAALSNHHQQAGQEALASAAQERSAASAVVGAQAALAGARRSAAQSAVSSANAISDAQRGVTQAEQAGARASQQAAQAVADARRGLAVASEQAAAGVQSALRQQGDAEERLAEAQRAAKQAQEDLTSAREDARRKLAQYTLDVAQAALNEQQAQLDLADSKKKLDAVNADPTSTIDARKRAELAYEQQLLQVKELSVHNKELRADAADAAKKGVKGSDEVVAARQREKDAARQVVDAQRGVKDAIAAVAKAQRDGAREIADAQRQIARAVQAQGQTEIDNSQRVADAQRTLSRARAAARVQAVNSAAAIAGAQTGLNTALANQRALNGQVSASQQKVNDAMKALSPAGRDFVRFLSSLGPLFKPLQAAAQGGLFPGLTKGITAALPALPNIRRVIGAVAGAMGSMAAGIGRAVGGPGGRAFIDFIGRTAPRLLRLFGRGAGYLTSGLIGMARAFMPVTMMIARGLTNLVKRFALFSNGGGFAPFVAFMVTNGPVIADVLGRVIKAVGRLVVAALPIGMAVLRGFGGLADIINRIPVHTLTVAIGVIGAIVLGLKAWEIGTKIVTIATKIWAGAQWLLNAALDANPIGLVVLAIGVLAAAFVVAYKKSATFRAIVNGALHAVKDAASAVVGWFTHSFVPLFTQKIPAAFHATLGWVKSNWPYILAILIGPVALATVFIVRHWDTITAAFSSARRWVVGTFRSAWSNVTDVLLKPIRAARDAISNIFGAGGPIRSAFSAAVSAIDTIWGKLKGYALAPVRFIVNTVYNNGIRKVVNAIPGIPGSLGIVKGFRTGGPTGSGRDDEAVGVVHGNEHVVTADEVRRTPGGHGTWERIRAAAMAGVLPGYKGGGAVWPTTGHITSTYPGHDGVDINGPGQDYGNPIYAWRSGRITYAGWNRGYGHAIFEQAPGYPSVVYGHGSAVYVHSGQAVRAGQMIGRVGSTGNSTGPHLHFGHPGGTSALAYALLRGAGSAGQGAGGTAGGSAYSGPSLGSVLKYLNPGTWLGKLKGMGGWGPMLAGTVGNMASSVKNLATAKIQAAVKAAGRIAGSVGNFVTHGPGAKYGIHLAPAYARQSAFNMMPSGWSRTALDAVVKRESGWRWNADNPYSSAYGIPQALPGSKMASAGPDWHDNALTQIKWMFGYIKSRYGTPSGALAHERSHGWYDQGGIASGSGFMQKRIIKPERVLSPRQTDLHDRQTVALEKLAASGGKAATGGLGPLIGHADIHTEVDLDKYERQRAFRERAATV